MDIQIETETKNNKKILLMKPVAPEFEGEEFNIKLVKSFPSKDIYLGVFRGIVGKDLVCSYITDPFEGDVVFVKEEPKGYIISLEIKDEVITKHIKPL